MNVRTQIVRHVLLPIGDVIRSRSLVRTMKELEATQWWPRTQLVDLQAERLATLVSHAYERVPYYREVMQARKLTPVDIRTPADLAKLPLLTREDVRANYPNRLCAQGVPQKGWWQGRTGGSSTGEPLRYIYDRHTADYGRAVFYRGWSWAGCPPGTPMLDLWGQPVAKLNTGEVLKRKAMQVFFGTHWVDAFRLNEDLLRQCAEILQEGRVEFIHGYASSLRELCCYLHARHIQPRALRAAMTTAEVLLLEVRHFMEAVLQAPVFNAYGCGEVNGIAYECERHNGLHVGMERAIVEIVDPTGEPVSPGQSGQVAVTDLHNFAMPLIRYLNGDEAQLAVSLCGCGRDLVRLQEILGRTCDIVDGVNGQHVHSYYFASLFGALGWVQTHGLTQFQIIQENEQNLRVRLVIRDRPSIMEKQRLLDKLNEFLGPMQFQVEYCEYLEPSPSGKFRWTINRLRSHNQVTQ